MQSWWTARVDSADYLTPAMLGIVLGALEEREE